MNIQATSDLVQYGRDVLMNQPYFTVIARAEDAGGAADGRDAG